VIFSCDYSESEKKQNTLFFKKNKVNLILKKELALGADTNFKKGNPSQYICPTTTKCDELTHFLRTVRKSNNEIPLTTKYYFGSDSLVQIIQYEWTYTVPGLTVEEREQQMSIESKRFEHYLHKLNQIANILKEQMGEPTANDGEIKKNPTSLLDIYKYNISFEKNKKHVDLKLVWSPKRGARFFKVWAKVYWLQ